MLRAIFHDTTLDRHERTGITSRIGFDWLCFLASPSFLAQKRGKLALFGAGDDTSPRRIGPALAHLRSDIG